MEIVTPQHQEIRGFHGDNVGGTGLVIDQGHLAEEIAVRQRRQDYFASVLSNENDLDLTLNHDIQRVTRVVLKQDYTALGVLSLASQLAHPSQFLIGEMCE